MVGSAGSSLGVVSVVSESRQVQGVDSAASWGVGPVLGSTSVDSVDISDGEAPC